MTNEQGDGTGGPSCSRKEGSDTGRRPAGRPKGTKVQAGRSRDWISWDRTDPGRPVGRTQPDPS